MKGSTALDYSVIEAVNLTKYLYKQLDLKVYSVSYFG